jgi:hypothetical protein
VRAWRVSWVLLLGGCFDEPDPAGSAGMTATGEATTGDSPSDASGQTTGGLDTADGTSGSDDASASSGGSEGGGSSSSDGGSGTTGGVPEETLLVSLHDELCEADIRSYEDPVCGVECSAVVECDSPTTEAGHAIALASAELEDGMTHDRVIELATYITAPALITAHFDGLSLADATAPRLRATVWCGSVEPCEAWWQAEISVAGVPVAEVNDDQTIDGQGATVDLDLAAYVGETVRVTLRMSNHGAFDQGDRIRFADPRLVDVR